MRNGVKNSLLPNLCWKKLPDFEVLDSTIAGGFRTMIAANFKRQVAAEESTILRNILKGRQIAWLIYKNCKIGGESEAILDLSKLMKLQFRKDNVQSFDTKWDEILSVVIERGADKLLDSLYRCSQEALMRRNSHIT